MSHFSSIKTQIKDIKYLQSSLDDLKYSYEYDPVELITVRGYGGNQAKAELVVRTNSHYDIGFQKQGDNYDIVTDWWGIGLNTNINQENFVNEVNQHYAYHKTIAELKAHDFYVESEVKEEEVIVLTVNWYEQE